jgi:hypothetical protein
MIGLGGGWRQRWRCGALLLLVDARKRPRDGEDETQWGIFFFLRVVDEAEWEAVYERTWADEHPCQGFFRSFFPYSLLGFYSQQTMNREISISS